MLNKVIYTSTSEDNTKKIARLFAKKFISTQDKATILLKGDLGSGKTTFTRYVLNFLGIDDDEFEGSPTFTIINEYRNNIFHIDLYRLKSKDELESTGLFEILDKNGIFFIEWPEFIEFKKGIFVTFEILNSNRRKIIIDKR